MFGLDISDAPDLQVRCKAAFRERLFAIMLMGYEAELHSQAGGARRRGGVPERCPSTVISVERPRNSGSLHRRSARRYARWRRESAQRSSSAQRAASV